MHLFDKASFLTDALYNSALDCAETRPSARHMEQFLYRLITYINSSCSLSNFSWSASHMHQATTRLLQGLQTSSHPNQMDYIFIYRSNTSISILELF